MRQERKRAGADGGGGLLERPLPPRSLIASLLLGMRPPRIAGSRLVEWCALFGVAEGTARVALSRMVERGELVSADGVYELAGPLRRRQPVQDWSLAPELTPWRGEWLLGVVHANARSAPERAALRDAARHLRLAELREGVWARPDNLPRAAAPAAAWVVADAQCAWWTARPERPGDALAAELFDPDAWAERAVSLRVRLDAASELARSGEGAAIAEAFVVGAAALTHIRADPLLPRELCGARWPGEPLRAAYRDYQATFAAALRDWFRAR